MSETKKTYNLFTNKMLIAMIIPIFIELALQMLVGIVDSLIISYCGEAAVAGVTLTDQIGQIFIMLFSALSAGGAVVISQYIGSKDNNMASESSSQLLSFSVIFSIIITIVVFIFHTNILVLLFGSTAADVMDAAKKYLMLTCLSYPFIAIYNSGAAVYRSIGKTKVTMYISIISNLINVVGNIIGVFVLKAGVAGVAYPTILARLFSAVAITFLCCRKTNGVYYASKWVFHFNGDILKKVLGIAIPNGIENAIFQFVKVALTTIVAMFGTYQIAANGVAQTIWSLAAMAGSSMAPVFITVIGQCMGSGDTGAAEYYFKKLLKFSYVFLFAWNVLVFALTPVILHFYSLSDETKHLIFILVIIHNIFCVLAHPFFSGVSAGLKAAGDVKFTMYLSLASTILVRLVFSYILGLIFHMGVIGIAIAMVSDWVVRAIILFVRLKQGKWKTMKVI